MILARLAEFEQRHETTPAYYTERSLRYVIELDGHGDPLPGTPRDLANPEERSQRRGQRRPLPTVQRSSGIRPILFADKADYTLGPESSDPTAKRSHRAHQAYLELVLSAAEATDSPEVEAVLRFLQSNPRRLLELPKDFDESAYISFTVDGVWLIDLPPVQAFWADVAVGSDAPEMQCLVCGEIRQVMARLPLKIKGIPGGQSSGTSIISANAEAFESYGLEASLIAPVCDGCAQSFTKGLNRLLSEDTSRVRFTGGAYVFWTREQTPFEVANLLERAEPGDVKALFASVRRGRQAAPQSPDRFYAIGLSGSGARTTVRDWLDATIPEVEDHLAEWFTRQRIVDWDGETAVFGLWALVGATVRELRDAPARVFTEMIRSALLGLPLPESLLATALRRAAAEQGMTAARAGLVKAVLATRYGWKEDEMVELDRMRPEPAYNCGRLLAVLENAQRQAIGVTSVTERYYGAASTAPASVFGALMKGVVHHLAKLQRDRPGAYYGIQRDLEEIASRIEAFPKTLSLREQGLFALGYYHQRHARWTKSENDKKE